MNLSISILISTSKNALSLIIAFVFSPTKLEIRAEQILPGSERGGELREAMIQTMYAHMNKRILKKKKSGP
jgi:hypothetical protein